MSDIIKLLPDSIANQIAAGEVVQRPASVVKELLENSLDANATSIDVVIKDAGKSLIQVIDNGSGMSETDARLCVERHATSKLRTSDDLFAIRSMGFRGEAMASIAAVAQLEIRTRLMSDDLGTRLLIAASEVKEQEPIQTAAGTITSVKNLFFNVPARRKFLKSNTVEMRHILMEFQRIALAHPEVAFSLTRDDREIFKLQVGNIRQRIVAMLGGKINQQLVPVDEQTDVLKIRGYIGKPEAAKKKNKDQYFFVNRRFIKSGYLNHALRSAYHDLIPKDAHPMYVLFLEMDPSQIDVNVHPTKQEIKFDDERLVYNYIKVAAKHALGQHNVMPSLDFDQDQVVEAMFSPSATQAPRPQEREEDITFSSSLNTRSTPKGRSATADTSHWRSVYEGLKSDAPLPQAPQEEEELILGSKINADVFDSALGQADNTFETITQIDSKFILVKDTTGILIIDQRAARERILFESLLERLSVQQATAQGLLFAQTIALTSSEAELLREIFDDVKSLGFELEDIGGSSFVVNAVPAGIAGIEPQQLIEMMLTEYELTSSTGDHAERRHAQALASAGSRSIINTSLTSEEQDALVMQLFSCDLPAYTPSGRRCFARLTAADLTDLFQ